MPECDDREALLVWDAEGAPPAGDWRTVLWRDFGNSRAPEIVSVPRLVETHAEDLKTRYLKWVYELGERAIQGRRVIDHLALRPGFSYWWMTLITEKCNYSKSPQITEAIRLMAFENWMTDRSVGSVVLVSANQSIAKCFRSWCAGLGVSFEWRHISDKSESLSRPKRIYQYLPHPLQAFIWMGHYLIHRWPLRGVGLREWRETKGRATFVTYLFNLRSDATKDTRFESTYWAHLPDDLQSEGCKTNWLHLYVKDASLPTAGKAAEAIRKFNQTGQDRQAHITLDAFLGVRVVIRTLLDWVRLAWTGRRLQQALSSSQGAAIDLWPLFDEDWRRSMFGFTAMNNALYLNLIELALELLPEQQVGVYLQENQAWEFGFIYAWKSRGHGRLIGSPHSTVRYWDLRYFFDPRSYCRNRGNDLPLPDQVAYNGAAMLDTYHKGGYPLADMVEVEALRYLHLSDVRAELDFASSMSSDSLRILVLGDYILSKTQQQIRLLEKAVQYLPDNTIITIKPHPACPILPADYPGLRIEVTMEPLSSLLAVCDVAYTSSGTSAAVDAYCACTPVVSVLDPNALNLSPLRGREDIIFVSTSEELAYALISAASATSPAAKRQDFFTLDPKLPRWRKLLLGFIG